MILSVSQYSSQKYKKFDIESHHFNEIRQYNSINKKNMSEKKKSERFAIVNRFYFVILQPQIILIAK